MESKTIRLSVDKVLIRGPKVDGGYSVTLEVGEYMKEQLAELIKLPTDQLTEVIITTKKQQ